MECGEALLGYEVFSILGDMFLFQDITFEEWNKACCDADYANELIELYNKVPSY